MSGQYKIIVPKAGYANEGGDVKTYLLDEIVDVDGSWQKDEMDRFVASGWAIETKIKPVKKSSTDKPKKKKATAKKKTSEK